MFENFPLELLIKIFRFYFKKNNKIDILKFRLINKRFSVVMLELPKFYKLSCFKNEIVVHYYELKKSKFYSMLKFISAYGSKFKYDFFLILFFTKNRKIIINRNIKESDLYITCGQGILLKINCRNNFIGELTIKNFGGHVVVKNLSCNLIEINSWSKTLENVTKKNFKFETTFFTRDYKCSLL